MYGSSWPICQNEVHEFEIYFRLTYYTNWGKSLMVCGSEPVVGAWNVKKNGLLLQSNGRETNGGESNDRLDEKIRHNFFNEMSNFY